MYHIVVLYSWSIFIWIINKFTYYYVRWKVSCYCILWVLNNYSISHKLSIWIGLISCVSAIFFFWCTRFSQRQSVMFMHCSYIVHGTHNHFILKKKIKNESHDIIHTFKNYFVTVFSVFSFQQNKLYSNGL